MTNFRRYVALSATVALIALGLSMNAQDDLDDLLADLEAEAPAAKPAAPAPAVAEPEPEPAPAPVPAVAEPEPEPMPAPVEPEPEPEPAPTVVEPEPAPVPAVAEPEPEPMPVPVVAEPEPEPAVAEPAPEVEATAKEDKKIDDALSLLDELAAEDGILNKDSATSVREQPAQPAASPAAVEAVTEPIPAAEPAPAAEPVPVAEEDAVRQRLQNRKDGSLISEILTTEKLRREAMDRQAMREIAEAKAAMVSGEYVEAVRHYGIAVKLLNDSPKSIEYRRECTEGIAEGLYRAALEEDRIGRRTRAVSYMEKALDLRHPKARRQLEAWRSSADPDSNKVDVSEITHRRNETDYKALRETERRHLKRARHLLAQREIDSALEECDRVLAKNKYNEEALRLRESILAKRDFILKKEREVARDGWIADVDAAWRPPYEVNFSAAEETKGNTVKKTPEDGKYTVEQTIIQRMKAIRLPAISFKPPATIIDAVEHFRIASKDYDDPARPLEQRGFNMVLKPPKAISMQSNAANAGEADDFTDTGADENAGNAIAGIPVIPMITASDISFYDALKLVCESVEYKFTVQGPFVIVMHKDAVTEELVTRSFPVLSSFTEKMASATEDIKQMKGSSGFGGSGRKEEDDGEEDEQRDWKKFFKLLGVEWPEGSTITYVKTVGRLFVKNTQENLAVFENVLAQLNQQVTLVEIETRFIEVCQDDLNSLGFEWILNGDYTIGMNKHLSKALGIRKGQFGTGLSGTAATTGSSTTTGGGSSFGSVTTGSGTTGSGGSIAGTSTAGSSSTGASSVWMRGGTGRNVGVNAIDGENYSTGQRYLSTLGNHVSGDSYSTNDKFMKVNAFLGSADLSMILHMLAQRSDTDLLSAPKVLTCPSQEATMKVVTEYIYPTDYQVQLESSRGGGSSQYGSSQSSILAVVQPQNFVMREVGVILTVTPNLTDDGNVVDLEIKADVVDEPTWKNYGMKIPFTGNTSQMQNFLGIGDILTGLSSVLSTLGSGISDSMKADMANRATESAYKALDNLTATGNDSLTYYDAPMEQPFFHVRTIESKVSVYPGATIVMGGLITEIRKAMDDKIPFLGDIPFIGRLFRSHAEQTSKRNLLIFVTTRIVDGRGREMHSDGIKLSNQDGGEVVEAPEVPAN